MRRVSLIVCSMVFLLSATIGAADDCVVPAHDQPPGAIVRLPPVGCGYLSVSDVHEITAGLPIGTEVQLEGNHSFFQDVIQNYVGAGFAGAGFEESFQSKVRLRMTGTGALAGFTRVIEIDDVPVVTETTARTVGTPFTTGIKSLVATLPPGDPDFQSLTIRAGSDFVGLASPGQTTLTPLGAGSRYLVDSFFDVTYEIDFVGDAGGDLAGLAGVTTGTLTMEAFASSEPVPGVSTWQIALLVALMVVAIAVVLTFGRRKDAEAGTA